MTFTNYDPELPECSLVPVDANNLYGHQLSRKLPKDGFEWLTEDELQTFHPMEIDPNEPKGYFLVVNFEYPARIHDATTDLP